MSAPIAAPLTPEQIARRSRSSFLVSFAFLSRERRRALVAVYAFCRVVDDAGDDCETVEQGREQLAFWRTELDAAYDASGDPSTQVGVRLRAAATAYGVPKHAFELLLEGVTMDLEAVRLADLDQLERYCYRVASAVGLACLPVFGVTDPAADGYARSLGLALQLTNVLRDLRVDAEMGRIYAPGSLLAHAGVDEKWLLGSGPAHAYAADGPVHRLERELAARAREHFATAARLLRPEWRRHLLPAEVMGAVYQELLDRIERRRGDLRGPHLRIPTWRKLWLAWRTMRRVKRA